MGANELLELTCQRLIAFKQLGTKKKLLDELEWDFNRFSNLLFGDDMPIADTGTKDHFKVSLYKQCETLIQGLGKPLHLQKQTAVSDRILNLLATLNPIRLIPNPKPPCCQEN